MYVCMYVYVCMYIYRERECSDAAWLPHHEPAEPLHQRLDRNLTHRIHVSVSRVFLQGHLCPVCPVWPPRSIDVRSINMRSINV